MTPITQVVDLIAALDLPPACQVDRKIPKTLLIEHGTTTAADKRAINNGIESCRWIATIKPETAAVPEYRDAEREYLEINILVVAYRPGANQDRLTTILHRSVPYPIVLVSEAMAASTGTPGPTLGLSLAHLRRSQNSATAMVLDGKPLVASIPSDANEVQRTQWTLFAGYLALGRQSRASLHSLYQGWIDTVQALHAAQVTGKFALATTPELVCARREALATCARLQAEMASLRAAAGKETQLARRVDLNLNLKRAEAAFAAASANL